MINWEDLRYFQAIGQQGTLSGAARVLGVDNATVSRRLAALEEALNIRLVDRLPRASRLTAVGQRVLDQVAGMEEGALAVERLVLAARSQEHGKVVITAPPIMARHFLAPNLRSMAERHPLVQLSILSESSIVSLSRLDADLALRLSSPIEDTDVAKKIGRMDFALYAACDYPNLANADDWGFIAYTERQADFAHLRWLYEVIGARRVVCEVTDLSNQYEAACSGIGVAGLPCFLADADPRLKRLPAAHPALSLDVWIAMHPDRRYDKLVRNTMRHIAELVAASALGSGPQRASTPG
jgi:DNA-binding transcriptional LysR family regulator